MSRKQCKRRHYRTGSDTYFRQLGTIYRHSVDMPTDDQQRDVLLPGYVALDELRAGRLDASQFVTLNEVNCMTWQMGRQVAIHRANADTGYVALQAKDTTEAAAEALSSIGIRWRDRGRFVATGDELEAIRVSFDMCSQLIALLPSGMVLQALMDAESMVRGTVGNIDRAA